MALPPDLHRGLLHTKQHQGTSPMTSPDTSVTIWRCTRNLPLSGSNSQPSLTVPWLHYRIRNFDWRATLPVATYTMLLPRSNLAAPLALLVRRSVTVALAYPHMIAPFGAAIGSRHRCSSAGHGMTITRVRAVTTVTRSPNPATFR